MSGADERHDDLTADEIDELRSLARTVTLADGRLEEPPASVWAGIEAALADEAAPGLQAVSDTDDSADAADGAGGSTGATRPRRPFYLAVAAAALAVAGVGGGILLSGSDDDELVEVAMADIVNDGLPVTDDALGEAVLLEDDGRYVLEIDVEALDTESGYLELWVINSDVTDMHSLGRVDGDGRFELPEGVDPADFPVVDISIEQDDGDATHSGQSVLRGILDLS